MPYYMRVITEALGRQLRAWHHPPAMATPAVTRAGLATD
jgi:hypothetical protein